LIRGNRERIKGHREWWLELEADNSTGSGRSAVYESHSLQGKSIKVIFFLPVEKTINMFDFII
jgi:hypothetical protein